MQPVRATEFQPDELATLTGWVVSQRARGKKIVFTNGCFDLLHAGHVCLLQTAACRHGDIVIVGVNTDAGARRLKGPTRPIVSYADRVFMLSSLRFVDAVVGFEDDPFAVILAITPDVLIKGAEYEEDDIIGAELVKARGGSVVRFPMIRDLSTTKLVEKLAVLPMSSPRGHGLGG